MVEFDAVKVKDQISTPEDTRVSIKRFVDTFLLEEGPVRVQTNTIGDSFILSHPTNGVSGTSTLGASNRVLTTVGVVNANNIMNERFIFNTFEDTGNTTADWADTEGELIFTNGEIAQSLSVALGQGTISKATISVTVKSGSSSDLSFQLSADGGSNWENVTLSSEHMFVNTGTDLRYKITASDSVTLSYVRIQYS